MKQLSSHPHREPVTPEALRHARQSVAPLKAAVAEQTAAIGDAALVVAWGSDLHLQASRPYSALSEMYATRVDTTANLALALAEVRELGPDLLVFGGDLADSGCHHEAPPDEYDELGRLLGEHLPTTQASIAILGNHDHADAPLTDQWHTAFRRNAPAAWPLAVALDDFYHESHQGGWRFIGLDSRQGQRLSDTQRGWLAERLAADPETPTAILVHRPFLNVGNWVDDFRLQDRPTLDLLHRSPSVRLLMSGHTHRPAAWHYRGQTHLVFPSLAYGIGAPIGWGVVVLDATAPRAVFRKSLATATYCDNVGLKTCAGDASWSRMEVAPFLESPHFNPCLLPR